MASQLFFGVHGSEDPTKATFPFLLANAAVGEKYETAIILAGDAVVLMRTTVADNVLAVGLPPLKELLAKVVAAKVPIYVCGLCSRARGITEQDLAGKNAKFVVPADAAKAIAQYDKVVSF